MLAHISRPPPSIGRAEQYWTCPFFSPMVEKNIKIDDLQFLIGRDGKVVIADPLGVTSGAPSRNNLRMIDLLIQAAEKK